MRVTENAMTDKFLYSSQKILAQKTKTQKQLATNNKIDTLSDDLVGSLQSIKIHSQMLKTDNYIQNANSVTEFMTASLQSLDNINTELQKVMVLAVDADNPLNSGNFATMAQSVKDSLTAMVQSVNTKQRGMYLFSGTNFEGTPVSIDPVTGKAVISAEDFSGEIKTQLSQTNSQALNIPGTKLMATGIFESLNNIIDSFEAGTVPTQAQKDDLDNALKSLLNLQSLGGQTINRMDDVSEMLSNQKDSLNEAFVKIQAIDVPALTVDLNNQDYLLQMSYKLLANTFPKSLFDYL